ncbi:hypothetical protein F383_21712 [Gossypium arboreum]|uniref:Uncharacterized protein n=1 Tax=Gossypium arboreum TaxID=29729 RepID=A0A0B0P230_GOSAR|nr:hypothetical protein F383_21712 [Gossypium arboreum]
MCCKKDLAQTIIR